MSSSHRVKDNKSEFKKKKEKKKNGDQEPLQDIPILPRQKRFAGALGYPGRLYSVHL